MRNFGYLIGLLDDPRDGHDLGHLELDLTMLTELADLHRDADRVGRLAILVLVEGGAGAELALPVLVLSVRRVPEVEMVADDGKDEPRRDAQSATQSAAQSPKEHMVAR